MAAGLAAALPPPTGLAMVGTGEDDGEVAPGLFNTTQVVGGSLALGILSTLAASRIYILLGGGTELLPATVEGQQLASRVATSITGTA
ncbi:hypothetical protein AB0G64_35850 [Streptomyces longwoodensis]|uniref:hypothetical protein n=1 Tax=Streptomyces longwoodensis TaxID=68231 RepID=UPI0033EB4966